MNLSSRFPLSFMKKLYAIDEDGKKRMAPYFNDLFRAIYPAFKERAEAWKRCVQLIIVPLMLGALLLLRCAGP